MEKNVKNAVSNLEEYIENDVYYSGQQKIDSKYALECYKLCENIEILLEYINECKEPARRTTYDRNYYKIHKEEIKARVKKYQQDNKEKLKAYKKEYRQNNRDKLLAYGKEYRQRQKGLNENIRSV